MDSENKQMARAISAQKSVGLGMLLTFFFGPFGMLYCMPGGVIGGVLFFAAWVVLWLLFWITLFIPVIGPVIWGILFVIYVVVQLVCEYKAVKNHNGRVIDKAFAAPASA